MSSACCDPPGCPPHPQGRSLATLFFRTQYLTKDSTQTGPTSLFSKEKKEKEKKNVESEQRNSTSVKNGFMNEGVMYNVERQKRPSFPTSASRNIR